MRLLLLCFVMAMMSKRMILLLNNKINMKSIHKKVSRSAYRRSYNEQSKSTYFQQMLIKSDVLDQPKLQQYLLKYCQPENPQGNSQRDWYDKDRSRDPQQILMDISETEQIKMKQNQNLEGPLSKNKYYNQFLCLNKAKNINIKVERQKFNIQIENYRKIMKRSASIITEILNQLKQLLLSLQDSLEHSRHLLQKHSKTYRMELDCEKQKQVNIQSSIKKQTSQLHHEFRCRNEFLALILKNGHYQENGLLWVLHQMMSISAIDQDNRTQLRKDCPIITSEKQLTYVFSVKQTGIVLKKADFPSVMDDKSREYMLEVFQKLKAEKSSQLVRSLQYQNKVEQYLKLSNQSYVHDNESFIFPRSSTHSRTSELPKQADLTLMLLSKTNDSLIQRHKMVSNVQIHAQHQKFNYDTKNIYANTREALNKWVKGKCGSIVKQKESTSCQPTQGSEVIKNMKVKTQQSLLIEQVQVKKECLMIQYVQSPISRKDVNESTNKTAMKSRISKRQGYSLPLIDEKQKQTPSMLMPTEKSNIAKISQNRYKNIRSAMKLKKEKNQSMDEAYLGNLSASQVQSSEQQDGKLHRQSKTVKSTQQKEQTRIVRLYPKQKQDLALKYMFGIHVQREEIVKYMYQ